MPLICIFFRSSGNRSRTECSRKVGQRVTTDRSITKLDETIAYLRKGLRSMAGEGSVRVGRLKLLRH